MLFVLALSSALLAGCGASTNKATGAREVKPVVLSLANPQPGDLDIGEWLQAVERLSRGAVRVEVRGDWRRGEVQSDRGTVSDLRAGRVDLAKINARAWDTIGVDSFQALDAPLLIDSFGLQERVLTGPLGASMLAGVRAVGVEPVAVFPGELRRPLGVSRDLLGPGDYSGAVIGGRPSAVRAATVRALGARFVGIPAPAGGAVAGLDGSEAELSAIDSERLDRQARSVTADVVLWPRPTTLVMNRDAWRRLTAAQRAVLTDAARAAVGPVMRRLRSSERGGRQALCGRRFSLVRAGAGERAALRRAVEPVYRQLARDAATRAALARIRVLKATVPAEPVHACGPVRGRPPPPGAPALVGAWRVRVTRELMAAARRGTNEHVENNWGEVTLVLGADGRFEMRNDRFSEPQGFGAWSSRDDVLTFTPGGTVEQGAGETWRYRWTLFRGSLVLRKLTGAPTALTVAPLRRR